MIQPDGVLLVDLETKRYRQVLFPSGGSTIGSVAWVNDYSVAAQVVISKGGGERREYLLRVQLPPETKAAAN